jgi:glycerol-3-phosphate dehydrogenase (NAD(P)+)
MNLPVGIVGGGSFGRALAKAAVRAGRRVVVWSRLQRQFDETEIRCTNELAQLAGTELMFIAAPSIYVAELADALGEHLDGSHFLVHVSRGLLGSELRTVCQVLRERTPCRRVGSLAGPLVAEALTTGAPGGAIVGSLFPEVADAVREAIGGPSLRIYSTDDVIGVEVAAAMVGLVALALGYVQGLEMGPGTQSLLVTRGVFESARIGETLGARERTFSGLAGFGDLIAAVAGDERPELLLGRGLAEGLTVDEAAQRAGAHVEGTTMAKAVSAYADRISIPAPVSDAVARVIAGEVDGKTAVGQLMERPARVE